jgi:GGDEF domain-containing protein
MLDSQEYAYTHEQVQLLEIFRRMAENCLEVVYQRLLLENKVEERTRELTKSNETLLSAMDEINAKERLLEQSRSYDLVTSLPNLHQLDKMLSGDYHLLSKESCFINIRVANFRTLSDCHGLQIKQALQKHIADLLKRIGTDSPLFQHAPAEFLFICNNLSDKEAFAAARHKYQLLKKASFNNNGQRLPIEFSIGIARHNSNNYAETLRQACYATTQGESLPERISFY